MCIPGSRNSAGHSFKSMTEKSLKDGESSFSVRPLREERTGRIFTTGHISVLQKEVIQYLNPRPGDNFIDGTCGNAGHALDILKNIGEAGKILTLDLDEQALARAKEKVAAAGGSRASQVIFVNDNFAHLAEAVRQNNFSPVNGILADIGMSSEQLENSGRGFSFLRDEALDMRFSVKQDLTASGIINQWTGEELEEILREYGEERFARRISRQIINNRKLKPILTTRELVSVIALAVPVRYQHARIHFATRTFQALRIAVNDELRNLKSFLPQAVDILARDGRLAVISFHSLEDRIVKRFFREQAQADRLKILTKRPITPSLEEQIINPRSRSAKLRAAAKL